MSSKPERDLLVKVDATARDRARRWWQFGRPTMALYATIYWIEVILVKTQVSKQHMFSYVSTNVVFDQRVVCTTLFLKVEFSLMQSSLHEECGRYYGSTLETRYTYTPTDCF